MLRGLSESPSFLGAGLVEESESPGALFFLSALFLQGGGMDLSRIGEKLLSSVRSARSLGLFPSQPDRPEVPARAAAAAAVARALSGIPPHQRVNLPSSSEELISIYESNPHGQSTVEDLEELFYEEDFDPVKHILEHTPPEVNDLAYFEEMATLRLAQLDGIAERLSHHVMQHHEEMVKGMQLVMELEQDLKVANVICMNGRRHLTSSMHEVSQDLVVNSHAKKKQVLLDMLPILSDLRRALGMQMELEILIEEANYVRAFQVLPEYLQVLDGFSELTAMQEMSRGVEIWLARTLQKLDSLLLGVCQSFKHENYLTAVDAYAIVGDTAGLAEKIQSFFMQEVLSETHSVMKEIVQEVVTPKALANRLTYSDLCAKMPESNYRSCLLRTLDILFKLMCSYYAIMSFQPEQNDSEFPSSDMKDKQRDTGESSERDIHCPHSFSQIREGSMLSCSIVQSHPSQLTEDSASLTGSLVKEVGLTSVNTDESVHYTSDKNDTSHHSPFYHLRKDAITFVAKTLDRGRKNLWQLITSRVSVLLTCSAACLTSTYQFLRNYEDLNVFILIGETFCGVEASEFRGRLKAVCESYVASFHRQNIHALRLVLDKETWVKISSDAVQVINLAGLVGDGAPLIAQSPSSASISVLHSKKPSDPPESGSQKIGFSGWLKIESPFSSTGSCSPRQSSFAINLQNGSLEPNFAGGNICNLLNNDSVPAKVNHNNQSNKSSSSLEDENEDLLADFIDEDSQLPSRIPKPIPLGGTSADWIDEEINSQTGSSLCLLRLMDKYARLMQKLEIVNIEFFKGICQLFGIFFHFIFEAFGQNDANISGKVSSDSPSNRLKAALSWVSQDCDQWIRQQGLPSSSKSSTILGTSFTQMDVTPTVPADSIFGHAPNTTFGLNERCTAAETVLHVSHVLHRSRLHLQSKLLKSNVALVDDFFENIVGAVPDLTEHIHRITAKSLLHINGYADKITNAKWEVKELGLEHNGYVDLLLGEFKHYKTRLAHGGIHKEVQDLLLVHGVENVAYILLEGLSRVKKCTDEGRALMSLDLQVLINGLQHFVPTNVRPKLQLVETFIKAYYLPETEYVYWARSHPEYSKGQIVGLINLVATMKSWKRKTRLEVLDKIEAGT